jgi:tRNA(Ile)-lysidine synthase
VAASLERNVGEYCRRHDLLESGVPVLAMVSGGADSVCLMHVLAAIHDAPVAVLTIDHGLRPDAAGETMAVTALAADLGLSCEVHRLALDDGPDLQERARDARAALALEVADRLGCSRIATGHTATDQAETVLFRLARGTGPSGAVGMAPRRDRFIRPLLGVTRERTAQWCVDHGIDAVSDPSNADLRFARARVRHGLIPALKEVHSGAERNVAAFADRLRDEQGVIEMVVQRAWTRCLGTRGLVVDALDREPPALQRLLLRRLFADAGLSGGARESRHVERARDLLRRPAEIELPGGQAAVVDGQLVVRRRERQPA